MENIQEHSLESFINLKELLSQQVNNDSKKDDKGNTLSFGDNNFDVPAYLRDRK